MAGRRLSEIMDNAEATWGDTLEKGDITQPFYIHGGRVGYVNDETRGKVEVIALNCTFGGDAGTKTDRFVIVVGASDERLKILEVLQDDGEPIGPVKLREVPLKGGRTFWRIEDSE